MNRFDDTIGQYPRRLSAAAPRCGMFAVNDIGPARAHLLTVTPMSRRAISVDAGDRVHHAWLQMNFDAAMSRIVIGPRFETRSPLP